VSCPDAVSVRAPSCTPVRCGCNSSSSSAKAWRTIYGRVTAKSPGLIPDQVPEELTSERGKEKKQLLLAYLREHSEELRPAVALMAL
jgi:hypothetical protein